MSSIFQSTKAISFIPQICNTSSTLKSMTELSDPTPVREGYQRRKTIWKIASPKAWSHRILLVGFAIASSSKSISLQISVKSMAPQPYGLGHR